MAVWQSFGCKGFWKGLRKKTQVVVALCKWTRMLNYTCPSRVLHGTHRQTLTSLQRDCGCRPGPTLGFYTISIRVNFLKKVCSIWMCYWFLHTHACKSKLKKIAVCDTVRTYREFKVLYFNEWSMCLNCNIVFACTFNAIHFKKADETHF